MDRDMNDAAGVPMPYGKACEECSRAKCSCIMRAEGGRCERCHRLDRRCTPSASKRRRNTARNAAAPSRRLEGKLDELLTVLKTGTASVGPEMASAIQSLTQETGNHKRDGSSPSQSSRHASASTTQSPSAGVAGAAPSEAGSTASWSSGALESIDLTSIESEQYFAAFKTEKIKYFPFIGFPPSTTGQQLRSERPFLWLCIMAISSTSTSQQRMLSDIVRHKLGQEIVSRSENNIDLLLGLLTFIGWFHYQAQSSNKPSLSVFTQLAVALVFDLGLNKSTLQDQLQPLCIDSSKQLGPSKVRTMEERRAALGCFLITSIISSFLQKIDSLRWTSHLDECLRELDEAREYPTDEILVQLVQLQLVVEKAALTTWYDGALETNEYFKANPSFYVHPLHAQLEEIKTKLHSQSQQNEIVLAHLYTTELTVNEMALAQRQGTTATLNFQRPKYLYACVESIKNWFDVFATIPPVEYIGFSFSFFSQVVRCLRTLYNLSVLDDPAWNTDSVRATTDVLSNLDFVVNSMAQAPLAVKLDNRDNPEGDIFTKTSKLFRSVRPGWAANLGMDSNSTNNNNLVTTFTTNNTLAAPFLTPAITPPSVVPSLDNLDMNLFDSNWLMNYPMVSNYRMHQEFA